MFYYQQEYEKAVQEIALIYSDMSGLRSPNLTDVRGTPEDRQHKLIRLGDKIKKLEVKRDANDIQFKSIHQKLHLYEINEDDYRFLTLLYKDRMTCDEVAMKYGYNNGKYVSRKRIKLLDKISLNI